MPPAEFFFVDRLLAINRRDRQPGASTHGIRNTKYEIPNPHPDRPPGVMEYGDKKGRTAGGDCQLTTGY